MADENIWSIANQFVVNIEETFYTCDDEFDSQNCIYLFYEIIKLFIEKGNINNYKIDIYKFLKKCYGKVDKEGSNDYFLFYDNLNVLLEFDYINIEDIGKLKQRFLNQIIINNKDKQFALSNIS